MPKRPTALNIVHGDSISGTRAEREEASALWKDPVLAIFDSPDVGPLSPTTSLRSLMTMRFEWWQQVLKANGNSWEKTIDKEVDDQIAELSKATCFDRVHLWARKQLSEQAFICMTSWALQEIGMPRSRQWIVLLDAENHSFASLEALKSHRVPVLLPSYYSAAWAALTSPDRNALPEFLKCHPKNELTDALRMLLSRYPNPQTGLGRFDTLVLEAVRSDWQFVRSVSAEAFLNGHIGLDCPGDRVLTHHMVRLAQKSQKHPPLEVRGSVGEPRKCEVRLTEFGLACLRGEANHAQTNGLDEWIGGVHVTGM